MQTFYDEKGKNLGQAWSYSSCNKQRDKEDHKPHSHNPEFACYGPYFCSGYPSVDVFDSKPRKPVNR